MTEFINQLPNANTKPLDMEKWREIIRDWEASKETQKQYCDRLGLNINTFSHARSKLSQIKKPKSSFIPVTIIPPSISKPLKTERITIENPQGLKLHISPDLSLDCLAKILKLCGWTHA